MSKRIEQHYKETGVFFLFDGVFHGADLWELVWIARRFRQDRSAVISIDEFLRHLELDPTPQKRDRVAENLASRLAVSISIDGQVRPLPDLFGPEDQALLRSHGERNWKGRTDGVERPFV
jgi:hypothetical protein